MIPFSNGQACLLSIFRGRPAVGRAQFHDILLRLSSSLPFHITQRLDTIRLTASRNSFETTAQREIKTTGSRFTPTSELVLSEPSSTALDLRTKEQSTCLPFGVFYNLRCWPTVWFRRYRHHSLLADLREGWEFRVRSIRISSRDKEVRYRCTWYVPTYAPAVPIMQMHSQRRVANAH